MSRGGARPGAGRPKGSVSPRARVWREQAREKAATLVVTPLDVMLENMKTCYAAGDLAGAHKAAADVAPYIHPKLTTIHSTVQQTTVHIAGDAYERLILEIDRLAAAEGEGESEAGAPRLIGGSTH